MAYVSCRYAPPNEMADANLKEGVQRVICTDENGVEWQLTDDSQAGDWLRFQETGAEVLAHDAPTATPAEGCD